jgi:hypothetical protein
VHKAEIAYTEADFNTDLNRLTGTADGFMDNVHALRNTFGADLVALVINDAGGALCGLAWLMNVNSTAFAPNGFSANHWTCISGNLTLAHEMGHNMSLNHDTAAPPGPFPFSYGRGYNNGTRRDIMAVASLQPRMQNFSNPAVNFVGTAEVSGTADRNAALALNNTRMAVANFRQAAQAFGDHNGDGRSDLLWQNDGGPISMWLMNGGTVVSSATTPIDMNWRMVGNGDYNGDTRADVLWRHTSGTLLMWLMNGTAMTSSAVIANVDPSYVVVGSGDFNADGKADILWRHTSGLVTLWLMDGTALIGGGDVTTLEQAWQIVSTGDQNGDRRADILWRHTGGMTAVYLMNGNQLIGGGAIAQIAPEWRIVGSADFNGDGRADILWRHTSGQAAMWFMNGATLLGGGGFTNIDPSWAIVGRGDYNGDGLADILWRHTSGQAAMWFMNGTTLIGGGGFTTIDVAWQLLDLGQPPPTNLATTRACSSLTGAGSFASPYAVGALVGSGHRLTGCQGFLQGDSRSDFFAFTIGAAQNDSRITLIYNVGPAADREVVPAIVRPDGVVIFDAFMSGIFVSGNEHRRVINLASLPGGPLAAGTWFLRTNKASGLGNAPAYDIVIDAPR